MLHKMQQAMEKNVKLQKYILINSTLTTKKMDKKCESAII